jgi:2-isopropylmalate synthase
MMPPHQPVHPEQNRAPIAGGTDAQPEVSVLLSEDGCTPRGRGAHHATLVASANAFNKLSVKRGRAPVDAVTAG